MSAMALPDDFGMTPVRTLARIADPTPAREHSVFWSHWLGAIGDDIQGGGAKCGQSLRRGDDAAPYRVLRSARRRETTRLSAGANVCAST